MLIKKFSLWQITCSWKFILQWFSQYLMNSIALPLNHFFKFILHNNAFSKLQLLFINNIIKMAQIMTKWLLKIKMLIFSNYIWLIIYNPNCTHCSLMNAPYRSSASRISRSCSSLAVGKSCRTIAFRERLPL